MRSLEHLEGLADTTDRKTELRLAADWALRWQRPDGLWGCFLDDPATLADTSGSDGIAAAVARAAKAGRAPLGRGCMPGGTRCGEAAPNQRVEVNSLHLD